ncbi:4-hydroxy-tetrahydrodipicolinate synthase [Rhodopseudomonas boonkerdii]|uniref:4-hydroxy-tetrahydrodipicolinate synthase n=1 Tax=Rhodopseudomonas boonkerdii TaxID=475937 RepID=UPI001E455812|nr:4-hydroxy-tetrahydrodipicolinate synthase [Rhodopseudomonas boonkerdii]UGV25638.1 4-hydroxy-tetrahydrodipicolinate synthase [Rhodopseudomonas boonkerdii]
MSALSVPVHAVFHSNGWLHGMIADLPTPFHSDGRIDLLTFARLCERQVCAGASAIVIGATAGEGDTLSDVERTTLIRTAVGVARNRLRVIVGAGSNCTAQAIEWTRMAQSTGAAAAISVVPYYNRPTADGIAAHFHAILGATTLPIILHDAPSRCARDLTDDVIIDLAASPRVIGLRDDTDNALRLSRLRSLLPSEFRFLAGHDATALSYLLAGGDGVISALVNVAPKLCRGMYDAARKGYPRYATTISDMLMPLADILSSAQVSSVIKYAMSLRGLGNADVRLPRTPLDETWQRRVETALAAIWASPDEVRSRAI